MIKVFRFLAGGALTLAVAFSVSPAQAACIGAGVVDDINDCLQVGSGSKDCLLGWAVNFDGSGGPPPDEKKITCVDGAACDADGHINGSCTFEVGACVNATVGGCSTATLANLELKKPSQKDVDKKSFKAPETVYNRRVILGEIEAMLPNGSEACTADDLKLTVNLKKKKGVCGSPVGQKCEADDECDDYCTPVYKKNKAVVKAFLDDGGSAKDSDAMKFTCEPADTVAPVGTCASAFQVADSADLIGGPISMGRVGDWSVRNGQIRTVMRDIGRVHSFMITHGGNIMDADLVRADPADDRDSWQGIQPMINLENTQNTQSISVLNDGADCAPAILRTSGPTDTFDVLTPNVAIATANSALSTPNSTKDNDLDFTSTTDYILRPDTNYVQIVTTLLNPGGSDVDVYMGDFMNPGGSLEDFGSPLGFANAQLRLGGSTLTPGSVNLDYMAYQGARSSEGVTYGVVFPLVERFSSGNTVRGAFDTGVFQQSGVGVWNSGTSLLPVLLAPQAGKPVGAYTIPAGGTNSLRRYFVVGETTNDVTRARADIMGVDIGIIQGHVTSGGVGVEGARVAFSIPGGGNGCGFVGGGDNCDNIVSATIADEFGFYRAWLPDGEYAVTARGPGYPYESGNPAPTAHVVTLKKKKTETIDVDLPATGGLRVLVTDHNGAPIAGKVSIVGFSEAADPGNVESALGFLNSFGTYFGFDPEDKAEDIFGVVQVLFADHSGDTGTHNLAPGTYHVVVSHGQEYDVHDEVVNVAASATSTVNATVNQVVDTTGFVSMDTHVHMELSPDSNVSIERRITTMLAEGVDFFVPTDHDFVHDINDEITAMGVSGLIGSAPSNEITTFSYGHFNVWPQAVGADVNGNALDWGRDGSVPGEDYVSQGSYDLSPAEIFGSFNPATQVIQLNHYNSGSLGHFNNLGIDVNSIPPVTSNEYYVCSGGSRDEQPCEPRICSGGANDGLACSSGVDCPAGTCLTTSGFRDCSGGTCVAGVGNFSTQLRLDPAISNLYDDGYTALEVWIEANRSQTELALGKNLADWAGLLNQGLRKAGIGDSDTHTSATVQAGGPRTFVASATDDPGLLSAATLALNVNAGRAVAGNGLFMRVELEGDGGATASHELADLLTVNATGGSATVNVHLEAPTWAEFDRVEIYANSNPSCVSQFTTLALVIENCAVAPAVTLDAGIDFTVTSSVGVSGFGTRLEADISEVIAVTEDTWVIVVARGTDGVSAPLFPMNPLDLDEGANASLSDLTDAGGAIPWNLGELGALATAFSNPLYLDREGDGFCHGGVACP
jgi:hypothetical protein